MSSHYNLCSEKQLDFANILQKTIEFFCKNNNYKPADFNNKVIVDKVMFVDKSVDVLQFNECYFEVRNIFKK